MEYLPERRRWKIPRGGADDFHVSSSLTKLKSSTLINPLFKRRGRDVKRLQGGGNGE